VSKAHKQPKLKECPCCGAPVLHERGAYEICPRCGWEDDPVQFADPDFKGGANKLSLSEARRRWSRAP
jgi:hypothetical protein